MLDEDARNCLLRAARAHLLKLKDDYNRLEQMAVNPIAIAAAESAAVDLACLQRAIAWLWRTHRP